MTSESYKLDHFLLSVAKYLKRVCGESRNLMIGSIHNERYIFSDGTKLANYEFVANKRKVV